MEVKRYQIVRIVIILILSSLLVCSLIKSIIQVTKQETTIDNKQKEGIFRFPTFTFCLQQPYLTPSETDLTTLEDLDQMINKTKESFKATLSVQGSNTLPSWFDNIELDLTNETILATYFPNTTLDDVWSFVPRTSDVPPFPLGICAQLSVPIKRITKKMTFFLSIRIKEDNTSDDGSMYMVEMMDKLMSRYNTQYDWSQDIDVVQPKTDQISRLNMIIKKKANSNHDPCIDSNFIDSQTCVDNIIVDALKCYPKWYKSQQSQVYSTCSGPATFQEFIKISKNLVVNSTLSEHCYPNHCTEVKWNLKSSKSMTNKLSENTTSWLYYIPSNTKVQLMEEILIYSWTNLLADFGGYLGLYLGGSILSLFDLVFSMILQRPSTN